MENIPELVGIQTRLKSTTASWQDALIISTSLFIYGTDADFSHKLTKGYVATPSHQIFPFGSPKGSIYNFNPGNDHYHPSSTVLEVKENNFSFATATFDLFEEDLTEDDNFIAVPKFVKEFKIRVSSLKIDKSLPKVFID